MSFSLIFYPQSSLMWSSVSYSREVFMNLTSDFHFKWCRSLHKFVIGFDSRSNQRFISFFHLFGHQTCIKSTKIWTHMLELTADMYILAKFNKIQCCHIIFSLQLIISHWNTMCYSNVCTPQSIPIIKVPAASHHHKDVCRHRHAVNRWRYTVCGSRFFVHGCRPIVCRCRFMVCRRGFMVHKVISMYF